MLTALLNIKVASSNSVCLRNFTVSEVLNESHERKSQYKYAHNSIFSILILGSASHPNIMLFSDHKDSTQLGSLDHALYLPA